MSVTVGTGQKRLLELRSTDLVTTGNVTVSGGTLNLGNDVSIFDDGTNILRTDDTLHANNNIHVGGDGKLFDRANTSNYIELANTINISTNTSIAGTLTTTDNIAVNNSGNGQIDVSRTSGANVRIQAQASTGVVGTTTNHALHLKTNDTTRWYISSGGTLAPQADSSYDIGTNSVRVANIYADTLYGDGSNLTNVSSTDSTKLPLAGGTMTGTLTLSGAPSSNLHAATKAYVDSSIIANTDTQDLSISGQTLSLTNGGSVTLPDADTQDLSISGQTLSLTNGGSVTLPTQTSVSGNAGSVTNGVYTNTTQTISGTKTFSGGIGGSNSLMTSFFLPQNPEGSHVKAPWFFNDMAYARLRGATVTVTVNGGSSPSNSEIDAMFDASTGFWNMSTSGVTSVVIELTNPPKTMYHGAHYGVTFGNTNWRANSVDIDTYYSGGYQEVVSITGNSKEFIYGAKNSSGNAVSKIRWTFSDFNTTSMRIVSLLAYNYNATGMPSLYLAKDGGEMYGAVDMNSNKITELGTPTSNADAATKAYVDSAVIANTDTQDLSISGRTISLTDGGSVTVPAPTYSSITGKPTTFAPTIGTTSTTAMAGNTSIPSISGLASETYVNTAISNLIDGAPGTLDTLNELAEALNDDDDAVVTLTNSITANTNNITSNNTIANAALPKAGGTMSGAIAMGNQNITGAGTITGTTLTGTSLDINGDADVSGNLIVHDQIVTQAAGSLLRVYKSAWTNATTHDILYQGWNTDVDDFIYLKSPGNTTTGHGIALIGDNVIAFGATNAETGNPELTSAAAPLNSNWLVLNSTSATFAGTIGSGAITSTGKITGTELEGTSLDINGAADISGTLTLGGDVSIINSIIHAGDPDTYFGFHNADEWRVVTGGTERFEITNSGATFNGNIALGSNSLIVSSRKYVARDGNGTGLFADDAASGLAIADNGNATFTGTIGSGAITSTGKITGTELEGTSLDINGNADVSGTLNVGGDTTFGGNAFGGTYLGVNTNGVTQWGASRGIMTWGSGYASIYAGSGNELWLGAGGANDKSIVLDGSTVTINCNADISGHLSVDTVTASTIDTDKFAVIDSGNRFYYRTGAQVRSDIGAGTSNFDGAYGSLSGVPSTFTPSSHTHTFGSLTSKPTTLAGYGITDALTIGTTSTTAKRGDTTTITSAQITKLGHISVSQAVDLDTMESSIASNAQDIGSIDSFPGFGTSSTTALRGDTALLQIGTTSTTALRGDFTGLQLGTTSTRALRGDLVTTTSSTSTTQAATANAVRLAYNRGSLGVTNAANASNDAADALATAQDAASTGTAAQSTANAALPKAGGTMTGNITLGSNRVVGMPIVLGAASGFINRTAAQLADDGTSKVYIGSSNYGWNDARDWATETIDTSSPLISYVDQFCGIICPVNLSKVVLKSQLKINSATWSGQVKVYKGDRKDNATGNITLTEIASATCTSISGGRWATLDVTGSTSVSAGQLIIVGFGKTDSGSGQKPRFNFTLTGITS